jgi:hypothetical protein
LISGILNIILSGTEPGQKQINVQHARIINTALEMEYVSEILKITG